MRIMKKKFKATLSVSWLYQLEIVWLQSEISGRLLPTKDNKTFWIQDDTFIKELYIFWTWVPEIAWKALIEQSSSSTPKQMNVHHDCQGYQRKMNSYSSHNISRRESSLATEIMQKSKTLAVKTYVPVYLYWSLLSWISLESCLLHKRQYY